MNTQYARANSSSTSQSVQALGAVITATGVLDWEPVAITTPGANEVLIRATRTLISPGTEMALWCGTHAQLNDPANRWAKYPFRSGYCAVGVIEAVGSNITEFCVGDRVAYNGRHASLMMVDVPNALIAKVPVGLDDASAVFAMFHSIVGGTRLTMPMQVDGTVIMVGAGIIGILAAQWLKSQGLTVLVEDVAPDRLEIAAACGLAVRLPTDPGEAPSAIIDATGVSSLIPKQLERVRKNGTVVLLGSPRTPVEIDVYRLIHSKSVSLVGAHGCRYPVKGEISQQTFFNQGLTMMADGRSRVAPLISHVIAPQRLGEAYAAIAARTPGWLGVELEWTND